MKFAGALLGLALLLLPHLALGQGTPVYQDGPMVPGHLSKFLTNGRIGDAGVGIGDGQVPGIVAPIVPTNADLIATSTATAPNGVWRLDYAAGIGAAPLFYVPGTAACSLNPSAGDGGSQVPSRDGKCWLARPHGSYSPLQFGAKGDGTADDTAAVQKTIDAAAAAGGPGIVLLGQHIYSITGVSLTRTVRIEGAGAGSESGFRAGVTNASVLINIISGVNPVVLRDFVILMSHGGVGNSAGTAIRNTSGNATVSGLVIKDACTAVSENGNSNTYENLRIISETYDQTGCHMFRVGETSNTAGTVDPRFTNITISGPGTNSSHNAASGFYITDCGGCFFSKNDVLSTTIGTLIKPGANQEVLWGFWSNTVVGDATSNDSLLIDTGAASAHVKGLQFEGVWAATAGNYQAAGVYTSGEGVHINNTASGSVDGVHFVGARIFNGSENGVVIAAGKNITIDSSSICFNSQKTANAYDGVQILVNVTDVAVRNNTIAPQCDTVSGANNMRAAITLQGNNNNITITGNSITKGLSGPVLLSAPINDSAIMVIAGNLGINDQVAGGGVVAATTIDAGIYPSIYITGATPISNITSGWAGREMTVTTASAVTFAAGGTAGRNMCTALTTAANATYKFIHFPGLQCWGHSP